MIKTLLLISLFCIAIHAGAQTSLVNFNGSSWKNPQTWLFNQLPADSNDVVLAGDIVIDTNAVCRSITSNGFSITVSTGKTLTITGKDSIATVSTDSLLSKIEVFWELTDPMSSVATPDAVLLLDYDTLNRVNRLRSFHSEFGLPTDTATVYYQYRGNDRLPYFALTYENCENGICEYDSSYFAYDSNGRMVVDSSMWLLASYETRRRWRVDSYQFDGERVTLRREENGYNTAIIGGSIVFTEFIRYDSAYFLQSKQNGNIVYQADTLSDYTAEHLMKYDQKKNPYYYFHMTWPIFRIENFILDDAQQPNNLLERREIIDWGSSEEDYTVKFVYRYGSNNFPVELFTWADGETPSLFKYYYSP